ncbi:MAG: hypothetical protein ACYCVM_01590 [Acidiferrobacter sp.]
MFEGFVMDKLELEKLEKAALGVTQVYRSVRRLAAFHKLDQDDCLGMALAAMTQHPGDIQAAIKEARHDLNKERRQRRSGRQVNDRFDGGEGDEVEAEVEIDRRTLPAGLTLTRLDDEGEYQDCEDQDGGDQASDDLNNHNLPDLPLITPGNLVSTVIFLSWHGFDVPQIAKRCGVSKARVRQILRDAPAIRRALDRAEGQKELFPPPTPNEVRAPREPRHHKPRVPRVALPASDQTPHPQPSLF